VCTAPADCSPGYGCVAIDMTGTLYCFPSCTTDADCRTGETCDVPMGDMFGTCT
jgi:hypothetical protein